MFCRFGPTDRTVDVGPARGVHIATCVYIAWKARQFSETPSRPSLLSHVVAEHERGQCRQPAVGPDGAQGAPLFFCCVHPSFPRPAAWAGAIPSHGRRLSLRVLFASVSPCLSV